MYLCGQRIDRNYKPLPVHRFWPRPICVALLNELALFKSFPEHDIFPKLFYLVIITPAPFFLDIQQYVYRTKKKKHDSRTFFMIAPVCPSVSKSNQNGSVDLIPKHDDRWETGPRNCSTSASASPASRSGSPPRSPASWRSQSTSTTVSFRAFDVLLCLAFRVFFCALQSECRRTQ